MDEYFSTLGINGEGPPSLANCAGRPRIWRNFVSMVDAMGPYQMGNASAARYSKIRVLRELDDRFGSELCGVMQCMKITLPAGAANETGRPKRPPSKSSLIMPVKRPSLSE